MTLFVNFITAVAWLWGGIMALGAVLSILMGEPKETVADFIRKGLLCWAWLIARYLL